VTTPTPAPNSGVFDFATSTAAVTQNFGTFTLAVNVTGSAFADNFTGTAFADVLFGGTGPDTLSGGAGNDSLSGGDGPDLFIYGSVPSLSQGNDTISDFQSGQDKLQLSAAYGFTDVASVIAALQTTTEGLSLPLGNGGGSILFGSVTSLSAGDIAIVSTPTPAVTPTPPVAPQVPTPPAPNGFNIKFDYRYDTTGFFNDPSRKAALEAAGKIWEDVIKNDFPDPPIGISGTITHPITGQPQNVTFDSQIDDMVLFVGGQSPVFGNPNASAAGQLVSGQTVRYDSIRQARPGDIFGSISFESSLNWFFDPTPATVDDIPALTPNDFISVAVHEIGHSLGFYPQRSEIVTANGQKAFDGPNSRNVNGGNPIPFQQFTQPNGDVLVGPHIDQNFTIDGRKPIMGTSSSNLRTPSRADLAILADIGYQIPSLAGYVSREKPPIATQNSDNFSGTNGNDTIDLLGGDDVARGYEGNDLLLGGDGKDFLEGGVGNDSLIGGAGQDFFNFNTTQDVLIGQDVIYSFSVAENDVIQIRGSGLTASAVLNQVNSTGKITFASGGELTVFSDAPLTASNLFLL